MNNILTFDSIGDDLLKEPSHKVSGKVKMDPPMRVRCAICRNQIAKSDARMSVSGKHEASFTNPFGFRFRVAFFQQAPGCKLTGKPTVENSWFSGYAWQIALCALCRTHLGWGFQSNDDNPFFGLIFKRLSDI